MADVDEREPETDRGVEFDLHNVGAGREVLGSADLAREHDHVIAVLLRNHYCPRSRALVEDLSDRYDEFAARGIEVVPVLPDVRGRALVWNRRYDLPFPMLADPRVEIADGGTPDEFDAFRSVRRTLPRLPGVAVFECVDDRLRIVPRHDEPTPRDAPTIDSLLARVDARRDGETADPSGEIGADS
ncbi:redoxin domain-containing protein [Haloarcula litorea]|uniref:redoxin domain-containing protein n=1 Tax=Haloarcula litorea TaxID=3032579 RepID=UPI0023E78774|nr:redoxin domain-containing protein [Halomicroarcula sp. GDY20]